MSFNNMNSNLDLLPDYKGILFRGKVVDNNDPLNLGRIKVSVPNLYDPGLGELPWCGPRKYSAFGQGASWGSFGSPEIGSDVAILLQNGNPHFPVYESLQAYEDAEFPTGGMAWGWRDPYGNIFKALRDKTVQIRTTAGVVFTVSPTGDLSVTVAGDTTISTSGNTAISTSGDTSVSTSGNTSVTSGGDMNLTSGGTMTLRANRINLEGN